MLERLTVRGFKSLRDVTFEPAAGLSVLFGPNAAGKSNLLEATQALSAMASARTFVDVLSPPLPVRGIPVESFSLPPGGAAALHKDNGPEPDFTLEADLATAAGAYRYRISTRLRPMSGHLGIADEYLNRTDTHGSPRAAIEATGGLLHIRPKGRVGRPQHENLGLDRPILSDGRFSGAGYEWFDTVRSELKSWRRYAPEPRFQMRMEQAPRPVSDIGIFGQSVASYLHRLLVQFPKHYEQVSRLLCACVPEVEGLDVSVYEPRGTLDLAVIQSGIRYSSHVVSEGTLRALAYCAIAVNPWANGGLVAVEEPENGVHPQRLEMIARLLLSLAEKGGKQVVVATHSPLFISTVAAAKRRARDPDGIGLFQVRFENEQTVIESVEIPDSVFENEEVASSLSDRGEQSVVEGLLLRGMLSA